MRGKKREEKEYLEQKMMPHDQDTEHAVLATLMRYNEKYMEFCDLLSPELFYYATEKAIYRCIDGVINGGGITDINSLFNYSESHDVGIKLDRSDFLGIYQLSSTATLEQDIRRLLDMSKRRTCWTLLMQASGNVLDVTLDIDEEINGLLSSLGEVHADIGDESISSFGDALKELSRIVNDNANGKRQCLQTGFKLFDDYYLLRPYTLTVIAAFTSVGKSALAMNICKSVAKTGVPCAYYSLEMDKTELASRSISKEVDLPASVILNKNLTEYQLKSFDLAVGSMKGLPIYFDDRSTVTFDKTIRSIRKLVKKKKIGLAVIDYLQIYSQQADNTEAYIAYMAREAKNIAKECGIPVILLSQLNRSGEHPNIKMLRGSGQIEESADNIVLIDRPEAYPDNKVKKYEGEFESEDIHGTAKFILSKGRGVGTGCSLVGFDGVHTMFYELRRGGDIPDSHIDINAPF